MLKEYMIEKREIVEKYLIDYLAKYNFPYTLSEAMKYSIMNGGKRIRPILAFMMCDLFEKDYKTVRDLVIALEFIHTYSLVHDDLPALDNDDYRRGRLTTHKKYSESTAILVGDAFLTEAFSVIAKSDFISPENKVEVIKKLTEYSGFFGMVGGQFVDIESEGTKISGDVLSFIHENKTGKLILASIECACILVDCTLEERERLIKYSKYIGMAFQIKDDLLDIEGDFEKTGKESNDVENDKSTYPSIHGIEKSKAELNKCITKAKRIIETDFNSFPLLLELANYFEQRGE